MSNKFDELVKKIVEGSEVERLQLLARFRSGDKADPVINQVLSMSFGDLDELTKTCCERTGISFDSLSVGSGAAAEEADAGDSLFKLTLSAGASAMSPKTILGFRELLTAELKNSPDWGLMNAKKKIDNISAAPFAFPVEYSKDDPELKKKEEELKNLGFSVKIEKV